MKTHLLKKTPIFLPVVFVLATASGCGGDNKKTEIPDSSIHKKSECADYPACLSIAECFEESACVESSTCDSVSVRCEDEAFALLHMNEDSVAPGMIETTSDAGAFYSVIDATAGGFGGTPDAYVYGRFTETGLQKIELDDQAALDSTLWHIAFQRYRIRLNSGTSGPSCVSGARMPAASQFDELSELPENVIFHTESSFTENCEAITDGGLGDPQLILSSYYSYGSCVAMTGNIYVLEIEDGRQVKIELTQYYSGEGIQEACDTGSTGFTPNGSATIGLRWAFLP